MYLLTIILIIIKFKNVQNCRMRKKEKKKKLQLQKLPSYDPGLKRKRKKIKQSLSYDDIL